MSGFEVAGVVLAAIPLIIEGMKQCHEIFRRLDFWRDFRHHYRDCKDRLEFQEFRLSMNLRKLLLPIFPDDADVAALLEGRGEAWKDPGVETRLTQRLGDAYRPYLTILLGFQNTLEDLKTHLAVETEAIRDYVQTKPNTSRCQSRFGRFVRRNMSKNTLEMKEFKFKFSNGGDIRRELFERLEQCNKDLAILLEDCDEVKEISRRRTKTNIDTDLCNFWKQAEALWNVLSIALTCRCRPEHGVNIQLKRRTQAGLPKFDILFTTISTSATWKMRYTRIEAQQRRDITICSKSVTSTVAGATSTSGPGYIRAETPSRPALKAETSAKTVSFVDSNQSSSISNTSIEAQANISEASAITDLCQSLKGITLSYCGYILDSCCNRRYYVYPDPSIPPTTDLGSVTLATVLQVDFRPRLSRRKRFNLARILSSSFLQLEGSSWLPKRWKKQDIVFYQDPWVPGSYIWDKPHAARDFENQIQNASNTKYAEIHEPLNRLAVVLFELCFDKPIELPDFEGPVNVPTHLLEKLEASEVKGRLDEIEEEAGTPYAKAVK